MNHGWLCTGEDMYKAPWFCNSYEIVRKAHFNSNKATKVHLSNIFIHQTLQNTHTTSCSSSLQYIAVRIHTTLHQCIIFYILTHCISSIIPLSSITCSTHFLQHIHQIYMIYTSHKQIQHIHHILSCCLHLYI